MNVFVADHQATSLDLAALRSLAERVLIAEGYPSDTQVSLVLVDDAEMADRNRRYLGNDGPTDVLAFPLEHLQPGSAPTRRPEEPPVMLGDVLIAPGYVKQQATDTGAAFEDEMDLMVVHGLLHLMGYDHEEPPDARLMEGRERAILGTRRRP
jgi:probable rRNA maturation factor